MMRDAYPQLGFTGELRPHSFIPKRNDKTSTGHLNLALRILGTGGQLGVD
jgi:hypothetical protein